MIEEPAICFDGITGEDDSASAGIGRAARLIESDVAVSADSEQPDIGATRIEDGLFELFALDVQVVGATVRNVGPFGRDVDMIEEMTMHIRSVALIVASAEAHVLIEVKGRDLRE